MKLKSIEVTGFKSFYNKVEIDFCDLTMLIGNNDIGKSSILDILDIALSSNKKPDENDFYTCENGENANEIEVILDFSVNKSDETYQYAIENIIKLRTIYTKENVSKYYLAEVPKEKDLRCDYASLSAQEQGGIIEKFDPETTHPTNNKDNRLQWFNQFIAEKEFVKDWKEAPSSLLNLLPRIQRYSAMDYNSPENLINNTVKQVFESVLYDEIENDGNDERVLRKPIKDIEEEAETKINKKVAELKEYIKKYAPLVTNISYEPQINFAQGFRSGVFKVDEGRGEHYLAKTGDGTKRKIFMATTDWDREVTLSMQSEGGNMPDVIRAYDEPDTNLDYQAQRQLYRSIYDIVSNENSNIQAIICTHSPRMIDRAPAQSIRMLKEDNNRLIVEKIITNEDDEVESFLISLAKELGITNTLMFYEDCFILVEGETEENALPLFYRTIYNHSLLEDGINIINVRGKGAFKEFLKLLSQNKQELIVVLMDRDCEESRDDKLTKQVLLENGFSDSFCNERIIVVGNQEFEDLFSNKIIIEVLNQNWPKNEENWEENDLRAFDPDEKKYSDFLNDLVWDKSEVDCNKWTKPAFGNALGKSCDLEDIPQDVKDLFNLARNIVRITEA